MITVSVCMIVKNEEKVLERCLNSLEGLYDELIIVDTGSSDSTKKIAAKYTSNIYDYEWKHDFSDARNFAMSKATMDYVYTPDADEVLDEENRNKFLLLKEYMDPQVEIVQMRYVNQLENGTVYNFDSEYRAKLYKRLRNWTFIEPVHEIVRTDPVVFDSDIDIIHKPSGMHADRDIRIFEKEIERAGDLSDRLVSMYVRELLKADSTEHFCASRNYFIKKSEESEDIEVLRLCVVILCKIAFLEDDATLFSKYSLKGELLGVCSEMCTIFGDWFAKKNELREASYWYEAAYNDTSAETDLRYKTVLPLTALSRIYKVLGDSERALHYEKLLKECR